jgi:hypothetical protein
MSKTNRTGSCILRDPVFSRQGPDIDMSVALAWDFAVAARYDACKIARVAAFIVSAHGQEAVAHARRLEDASVVPGMAKLVRLEVERLVAATALAGGAEATRLVRADGRI